MKLSYQFTREISFKATKKVKVYLNGQMDKFMMVNGKGVKRMEVECGKDQMMNAILANGKKEMFKDLASFLIRQEIDMKESLKTQRSMV